CVSCLQYPSLITSPPIFRFDWNACNALSRTRWCSASSMADCRYGLAPPQISSMRRV
ncbi:unnamed protein product, partial [Plutella xylostella]